MTEDFDKMTRIEREIEKRMESACEKDGWVVSVAMMPPKSTTLHIEKFGESPIAAEDEKAALGGRSHSPATSSEPRRRLRATRRGFQTPAPLTMSCSASRSTPRRASPSLRRNTRHVGSCRAFAGEAGVWPTGRRKPATRRRGGILAQCAELARQTAQRRAFHSSSFNQKAFP